VKDKEKEKTAATPAGDDEEAAGDEPASPTVPPGEASPAPEGGLAEEAEGTSTAQEAGGEGGTEKPLKGKKKKKVKDKEKEKTGATPAGDDEEAAGESPGKSRSIGRRHLQIVEELDAESPATAAKEEKDDSPQKSKKRGSHRGRSDKKRSSARGNEMASGESETSVSPVPQPRKAGLSGKSAFDTNAQWAGMYGGIPGTGFRHHLDGNERGNLPALVGKPSVDELKTPAYVRATYRHGTVGPGPPYKVSQDERNPEAHPLWTSVPLQDSVLDRHDWARTYNQLYKSGTFLKVGPTMSIRDVGRAGSIGPRWQFGARKPGIRRLLRPMSEQALRPYVPPEPIMKPQVKVPKQPRKRSREKIPEQVEPKDDELVLEEPTPDEEEVLAESVQAGTVEADSIEVESEFKSEAVSESEGQSRLGSAVPKKTRKRMSLKMKDDTEEERQREEEFYRKKEEERKEKAAQKKAEDDEKERAMQEKKAEKEAKKAASRRASAEGVEGELSQEEGTGEQPAEELTEGVAILQEPEVILVEATSEVAAQAEQVAPMQTAEVQAKDADTASAPLAATEQAAPAPEKRVTLRLSKPKAAGSEASEPKEAETPSVPAEEPLGQELQASAPQPTVPSVKDEAGAVAEEAATSQIAAQPAHTTLQAAQARPPETPDSWAGDSAHLEHANAIAMGLFQDLVEVGSLSSGLRSIDDMDSEAAEVAPSRDLRAKAAATVATPTPLVAEDAPLVAAGGKATTPEAAAPVATPTPPGRSPLVDEDVPALAAAARGKATTPEAEVRAPGAVPEAVAVDGAAPSASAPVQDEPRGVADGAEAAQPAKLGQSPLQAVAAPPAAVADTTKAVATPPLAVATPTQEEPAAPAEADAQIVQATQVAAAPLLAAPLVQPGALVVQQGTLRPTHVGGPSQPAPTNIGATRQEVLSFAQSLTSSIFKASHRSAMARRASPSPDPHQVAAMPRTLPPQMDQTRMGNQAASSSRSPPPSRSWQAASGGSAGSSGQQFGATVPAVNPKYRGTVSAVPAEEDLGFL